MSGACSGVDVFAKAPRAIATDMPPQDATPTRTENIYQLKQFNKPQCAKRKTVPPNRCYSSRPLRKQ